MWDSYSFLLMFMLTCLLCLQFQSTTSAQVQPSGEGEQEEDTVAWVNAAVGRIFWDFLSEPHWADLVSKKIQMKLSKIRVSEARPLTHPFTLKVVEIQTGRQEKKIKKRVGMK